MAGQGRLAYVPCDIPYDHISATVAGYEIVAIFAEDEGIHVPICMEHGHFLAGYEAVQDYGGGMRACRQHAPVWAERQGENPSEVRLASLHPGDNPVPLEVPH